MPAVIIAYIAMKVLTTPEKRPSSLSIPPRLIALIMPLSTMAHDGGGHCYREPYHDARDRLRGVGVYPHRPRDEAPESAENWKAQ